MTEFIILMASMISIFAISIDAMMPALGVIGTDLQATHANETQFIISSIFAGSMIGQLVCGPLSDALGRKKVLYGGLVLYGLGSAVCYFAQSMEVILLGRVIQGLGVSAPYVTSVAVVRDKYAGRDMARIMSLVMMIFILVPAVAPAIGQGILFFADWRAIFLLYICYAAVIGTWVYFRLEETLKPEDKIKFSVTDILRGFKIVFKNRITVCYTIAMGFLFGSFIGYLSSCQQIFQVQFGVGNKFALYFGALALVLGVASLVNSRIVQKIGMRLICTESTLCLIAASAIFLIVNLTVDVELWMFLTYATVIFFCFGLMFGNLNAIAMEPMGHIAGIASAVTGAVSSCIALIIGSSIGQLYNGTLIPVVTGFFVLNVFTLVLMKVAAKGEKEVIV